MSSPPSCSFFKNVVMDLRLTGQTFFLWLLSSLDTEKNKSLLHKASAILSDFPPHHWYFPTGQALVSLKEHVMVRLWVWSFSFALLILFGVRKWLWAPSSLKPKRIGWLGLIFSEMCHRVPQPCKLFLQQVKSDNRMFWAIVPSMALIINSKALVVKKFSS